MCLSNTLKEENKRFGRLSVKLKDANNVRTERVARAVVSVLSQKTWEAYSVDNYRNSKKYKNSLDIMRKDLIPKLPRQIQYRIYY